MIVCIDYDGSYTRMPELFDCIIGKCRGLGYTVVLATMRYREEREPWLNELMKKVDQTVFTGRKAKLPFLHAMGIKPDLWIDDCPLYLLNDGF